MTSSNTPSPPIFVVIYTDESWADLWAEGNETGNPTTDKTKQKTYRGTSQC